MSTLRSALEEFQAEDVRGLSHEELESDLAELERAAGVLEVERARRVTQIDHRGTFRLDGHLSTSSWLAQRFRLAWSAATGRVRLARALEDMPATTEALAAGEVSSSAVAVLVAAREVDPEEFGRAEATLVDAAPPIRELKHAVAYWRQAVDPERAGREAERCLDQRRLHVSPTCRAWSGWTATWTPRPIRPSSLP